MFFPVATGMEEHRLNALDSLEEQMGTRKIYHMHIGVSALFRFRLEK
jgi:hypothetical protein